MPILTYDIYNLSENFHFNHLELSNVDLNKFKMPKNTTCNLGYFSANTFPKEFDFSGFKGVDLRFKDFENKDLPAFNQLEYLNIMHSKNLPSVLPMSKIQNVYGRNCDFSKTVISGPQNSIDIFGSKIGKQFKMNNTRSGTFSNCDFTLTESGICFPYSDTDLTYAKGLENKQMNLGGSNLTATGLTLDSKYIMKWPSISIYGRNMKFKGLIDLSHLANFNAFDSDFAQAQIILPQGANVKNVKHISDFGSKKIYAVIGNSLQWQNAYKTR